MTDAVLTPKAEHTKAAIVEAATMRAIAQRAGVSTGSAYLRSK